MNEYELSLDNIFFFDVQIAGSHGKEFITSIVWLHNFQWGSWTRRVDSNESLIRHWKNSDAVVSFDQKKIIMSLMKLQFGLKNDSYINLALYCDDHLINIAEEVGIDYPAELDDFEEANSKKLWIEFIKGNESALESRHFFSAWNTNLIYQLFFKICGDPVPHNVCIPWALEKTPKKLKVKKQKIEMHKEDLYKKLKETHDFSNPYDNI
ncbi:MAG: hypothetical protein KAS17_04900 [Victivallaceae bacterium]|nr:hypothetical protein [Victivallaceae bacterium]